MSKILKNFRMEKETIELLESLVKVYQIKYDSMAGPLGFDKQITQSDVMTALIKEKAAAEKKKQETEKMNSIQRLR